METSSVTPMPASSAVESQPEVATPPDNEALDSEFEYYR